MKRTLSLALAGMMLLAMAGAAKADTQTLPMPDAKVFKAVLKDKNGTPVQTKDGECVRTMWESDCDECNMTKAPVIVSQKERTILFPFASSKLTKDAKKQLETLATELKGRSGVVGVRITGFADRIGSAEANEKLSKKRADAVRKFLVDKGVVNASVTETRWFGEGMPSTQCAKEMPKAELVKCLQNDRRVDVVVDTMQGKGALPPGILPSIVRPAMPAVKAPVKKTAPAKKM